MPAPSATTLIPRSSGPPTMPRKASVAATHNPVARPSSPSARFTALTVPTNPMTTSGTQPQMGTAVSGSRSEEKGTTISTAPMLGTREHRTPAPSVWASSVWWGTKPTEDPPRCERRSSANPIAPPTTVDRSTNPPASDGPGPHAHNNAVPTTIRPRGTIPPIVGVPAFPW